MSKKDKIIRNGMIIVIIVLVCMLIAMIHNYIHSNNSVENAEESSLQSDSMLTEEVDNNEDTESNEDVGDNTDWLSEDQYSELLKTATDYVNSTSDTTSTVKNKISIDNNTFIDGDVTDSIKNESSYEYIDSIYTKEFIIARYMNNMGDLKMIASMIRDDNEIIYNINDISKYEDMDTSDSILTNMQQLIVDIANNVTNSDVLNEYFILSAVGTPLQMIKDKDDCTSTYAVSGKSSLDIDYYDRILVQINDGERYSNVILKINTDGKIYDIDIV